MLNLAIESAKEAGEILRENFGKIKTIFTKGDRNLATNVDRKAEEVIVNRIKEKYPSHGILAEEQERKNLESDWLWVVDPLDGTHNFIRGIDIFGVSIGLIHKGEFVLGVIYMPVSDELYVGEKGGGAYKNGKKINVSGETDLAACSVSFDSSIRYAPEKTSRILRVVSEKVFNIRMLGSSARLLTYVAEGKLDAAIEFHDRPWDFAGAVAIIKEAGGEFTDLQGQYPTPKTIGYIASNPSVYNEIFHLVHDNL